MNKKTGFLAVHSDWQCTNARFSCFCNCFAEECFALNTGQEAPMSNGCTGLDHESGVC